MPVLLHAITYNVSFLVLEQIEVFIIIREHKKGWKTKATLITRRVRFIPYTTNKTSSDSTATPGYRSINAIKWTPDRPDGSRAYLSSVEDGRSPPQSAMDEFDEKNRSCVELSQLASCFSIRPNLIETTKASNVLQKCFF